MDYNISERNPCPDIIMICNGGLTVINFTFQSFEVVG